MDNDDIGVLHIDYPADIELSAGLPAEAEPGLAVPPTLLRPPLPQHPRGSNTTETAAKRHQHRQQEHETNTLPGRLELPTLRLTASRSNQLSYGSRCFYAKA